jgi:polyphosphate glucokinase
MSIDIGGSGLKAMLLDAAGKPVSERQRVLTPAMPTPERCWPDWTNCAS